MSPRTQPQTRPRQEGRQGGPQAVQRRILDRQDWLKEDSNTLAAHSSFISAPRTQTHDSKTASRPRPLPILMPQPILLKHGSRYQNQNQWSAQLLWHIPGTTTTTSSGIVFNDCASRITAPGMPREAVGLRTKATDTILAWAQEAGLHIFTADDDRGLPLPIGRRDDFEREDGYMWIPTPWPMLPFWWEGLRVRCFVEVGLELARGGGGGGYRVVLGVSALKPVLGS
ncbi:Uu.00g134740.m01.CDS01 [Anthostomella pinea]|uniref:Uu.00g134740.m01.CDS01 n=1 Tax=Anthostomella pinea TaxID=933095 RepID=A0AAI8YKV5_9PEZI|nr:Uu.00g134740.m01.CDS01 [Anthostomella pinea]